MSDLQTEKGQIVTFYSYKGGVGRTMALANVAFLAACNNLNVLMMDWDLEAPGLYHYFRGLMEPEVMSELRDAKGILDLAWQWRLAVEGADSEAELDRAMEPFETGEAFSKVVKPIENHETGHIPGKLDMIPAGSAVVDAYESLAYERALAEFSWADFLKEYAGGRMIAGLRKWATENYDLVLIDSRTGLADVAGICTMQLPDTVMLNFVLNRQNIEGVARVAAAIRANRGDEIEVRAVPMRVSREGTEEEADATARALRELTKIGGLNPSRVEHDLHELFVKAEPGIPFMESIAVFNESKAALDPFTADMARLAIEVVGAPIEIPEIDDAWRSTVLGRLSPTMSTSSYLRQLEHADPRRAMILVHQYLESALSTIAEGEQLPPAYLEALVETVFHTWTRADDADELYGLDTIDRLTALLRKVIDKDRELWTPMLMRALETSIYHDDGFHNPEREFIILEEMDELLSMLPQSDERLQQHAEFKLRMSMHLSAPEDALTRLTILDDAIKLLDAVSDSFGKRGGQFTVTRIEALIQKAEATEANGDSAEAISVLKLASIELPNLDRSEIDSESSHLRFEIDYRLMKLYHKENPGGEAAIEHAKRALMYQPTVGTTFFLRTGHFSDVIEASSAHQPAIAKLLLEHLLEEDFVSWIARFLARQPARLAVVVRSMRVALDNFHAVADEDMIVKLKAQCAAALIEIMESVENRFVPLIRKNASRGSGQSLRTFLDAIARLNPLLLQDPTSSPIRSQVSVIQKHYDSMTNVFELRRHADDTRKDDV